MPETYESVHLAQSMAQVEGPVLLCRASQGSSALPEIFEKNSIPFADIPCYDTVYENPDPSPVRALLEKSVLVTFTSASTVRGFVESLPGADLSHVVGCCIGPQTEAEAIKHGISGVMAKKATIESLIECIKEV